MGEVRVRRKYTDVRVSCCVALGETDRKRVVSDKISIGVENHFHIQCELIAITRKFFAMALLIGRYEILKNITHTERGLASWVSGSLLDILTS